MSYQYKRVKKQCRNLFLLNILNKNNHFLNLYIIQYLLIKQI